jgi:hypothetical protein
MSNKPNKERIMSENVNEILEVKTESAATGAAASEETKYLALRVISVIYKVIAIIIGIGAFIALIYGMTKLGASSHRVRAAGTSLIFSSLLTGIVGVIGSLAIAEIIKLFIDLEQNSRQQITLLTRLFDKK